MSNGVDRRAQMDVETFKALLLINGGGAVALLWVFSALVDLANSWVSALTKRLRPSFFAPDRSIHHSLRFFVEEVF